MLVLALRVISRTVLLMSSRHFLFCSPICRASVRFLWLERNSSQYFVLVSDSVCWVCCMFTFSATQRLSEFVNTWCILASRTSFTWLRWASNPFMMSSYLGLNLGIPRVSRKSGG
jgi:hypothetical protein